MKVACFGFVVGALVVACGADSASGESAGTADQDVTATNRATLDGYWKRSNTGDSGIGGITFNRCVGLDGEKICENVENGSVGSYLIDGEGGGVKEVGTYEVTRLPTALDSGEIRLRARTSAGPYALRFKVITPGDHGFPGPETGLWLADLDGSRPGEYRAKPGKIPASCSDFTKVVNGRSFLGFVKEGIRHDMATATPRGTWEEMMAKRPQRFDYPACSVLSANNAGGGYTFFDYVCDGAYQFGDQTGQPHKETSTTFPRFDSLYNAIVIKLDIGTWFGGPLTPAIDLEGETKEGCEQKLERRLAETIAATTDEDTVRYLQNMPRQEKLRGMDIGNACKVILHDADHEKLIPVRTRFVQVFDKAVFLSTGVADGEQCLTKTSL